MDLVRSWLGQALRATGAAVVVPIAILLALSLTGLGGAGLGGFDSLTQVVSGPEDAGSDLTVDDSDEEILETVEQLAAAGLPPRPGADPGGATAPAGGDGGGSTSPTGPGTEPGDPGGEGDDGPREPPDPGDGDNGDDGDGDVPPTPPEPPEPGAVEGLGDTVKDVTSDTPVGPTVEEAIDGLMESCGQLNCP